MINDKSYPQACQAHLWITPPQIMGILNVTPDSFYDGNRYKQQDKALKQAELLINQGADIIDIGGESTRPGAKPVSTEEELDRVIPIAEKLLKNFDVQISMDTQKTQIMAAAVELGVHMINDINALQAPGAVELLAKYPHVTVCLMHKQGNSQSMQQKPSYNEVAKEVSDFLTQRSDHCIASGINRERIILDPGFGFGKTTAHNLTLLTQLPKLTTLGYPILVGLSRKFSIGRILGQNVNKNSQEIFDAGDIPPEERLYGSLAAATIAVYHGATIIRTHDVKPTADAAKIAFAAKLSTGAPGTPVDSCGY